jgi:hypothetical protein
MSDERVHIGLEGDFAATILYTSIGDLKSSDNHPIFHENHLIKELETAMKSAESSGVAH